MIGAYIAGDKQTLRNLEELPTKMRRLALTRSMRVALKPLLRTAKQLAPQDTGKLRKNIKLKVWKRSRSKEAKRNPRVGMSIQVGEGWYKGETFYGAFQEFGWHTGRRTSSTRRRGGPDMRRWVEGKHFMEATYDAMGMSAMSTFFSHMPVEIEKLKFRLQSGGK